MYFVREINYEANAKYDRSSTNEVDACFILLIELCNNYNYS